MAIALAWVITARASRERDAAPIIIPSSFNDPSLSEHAGAQAGAADLTGEAAQDRLRQVMRNDGWAQGQGISDSTRVLAGSSAAAEGLFPGSGGEVRPVVGQGAAVAAYGTPNGAAGAGLKTSFYGTGGNATRIVYIIDNSGSMVGDFDTVRSKTAESVNNLVPLQYFGVVTVSDTAVVVSSLRRATPEAKAEFIKTFSQVLAQGPNDDTLAPFQSAFEKALAMQPQLIFFLTDGGFSRDLVPTVAQMNQGKHVKINTLEFNSLGPGTTRSVYTKQLQDIAGQSGGVYRMIVGNESP